LKDLPAWSNIALIIAIALLGALVQTVRELNSLRLESRQLHIDSGELSARAELLERQAKSCALMEQTVIQHRLEINLVSTKCEALDARLDIQNRTLDRVETKLDILLKSFETAIVHYTIPTRP
jgi:hypothetical protein